MVTPQALALIKKHEGLRLKPYRCSAGKLSIGYGRNLEENGISQAEANAMLLSDIAQAARDARALFPSFDSLSDARQAVLIDMAFNLGKSRFAGFRKLIAAVARGDWEGAGEEILDSDAGRELPGRYNELSILMEKGVW